MANEFIIKNGFQSKGDSQITGSLNVSSTLTVNGGEVGAAFPFSGAAKITGSLDVSGSITTYDINMSTWTLGADGGNNYYYFTGPGDLNGTEENPDIYLVRGQKYRFYNPLNAHPFQIQDTGGSAFNTGVTNNGVQLGFLSFDVPMDGPTQLKYQCTSHAAMAGNIYIANALTDTNFTQSLFVTPSGNDATAVVGNMSRPFQTILAATASANVGDTIIVYPGEYITSAQIAKDNVNYYFYPGAVVSGSTSLVAGTFENLNIRGHGIFKTNYNGAPVGAIIANGYFECDRVEFAGLSSGGYAGSPSFAQNVSADPNGVLQLRGDYKYGLINGARTGNSFNAAMSFGDGNIIANCNCFVSSSTAMMGLQIATTTDTDVIFNGDVYAENGVAVYTNDRGAHITINGRFETGNQATYEAIEIVPAYIGRYIINGEIIGSIRIDTGEVGQSGVQIDGIQICTSSPDSCAVKIDGGYNTLNHTIRASEIIFDVNGGETHFYGAAYVSQNSTGKLFDISAGKFVWNGMNTGDNIRALSNVVSGGELVINGPLEHYGSGHPNNTECFDLSGGILEIKNQVRYHQNTTGSGFIDMSGGYLKLNGAELIHNDGTGSYANCIKLTGGQTGSFFNNNFTNLNVFNDSSLFLNELAGSGSLFFTDKLR